MEGLKIGKIFADAICEYFLTTWFCFKALVKLLFISLFYKYISNIIELF